jgi:hypothetical protein
MTRSIYRIDPVKDLPFAQEFMETPVGIHSAGLQRILNVFRGEPLTGKYVLVEVEPHVKWQLAQLTGQRGAPSLCWTSSLPIWNRQSAPYLSCDGKNIPAKNF